MNYANNTLQKSEITLEAALELDRDDPLSYLRNRFSIPQHNGADALYFAGHSLGLMPEKSHQYIKEELDKWSQKGVGGHFCENNPWTQYRELVAPAFARLVGAKTSEVVIMNTLTVNLHLMMVSFFKPTKTRFKILIEGTAFPSDRYAVVSQLKFHGLDPEEALIEVFPAEGSDKLTIAQFEEVLEKEGDSIALLLLGNVNYLSGQYFDIPRLTKMFHSHGACVGYNLAHGAGNLSLNLHEDEVDFAVFCTYKYLNSGPGSLGACFIHEKHHTNPELPRFEGWWGTKHEERFEMKKDFNPIPNAEAWTLSNPPVLPLACIRASLEMYDEITMPVLRARGDKLTNYLEAVVNELCSEFCEIVTPPLPERGSMLCMRIKGVSKDFAHQLKANGAIVDFREPDIIRAAPSPLYTSYADIYRLVDVIKSTRETSKP